MFKRFIGEKSIISDLQGRLLLTENENWNMVPAGMLLFGWMVKGLTRLTSTK